MEFLLDATAAGFTTNVVPEDALGLGVAFSLSLTMLDEASLSEPAAPDSPIINEERLAESVPEATRFVKGAGGPLTLTGAFLATDPMDARGRKGAVTIAFSERRGFFTVLAVAGVTPFTRELLPNGALPVFEASESADDERMGIGVLNRADSRLEVRTGAAGVAPPATRTPRFLLSKSSSCCLESRAILSPILSSTS